MKTNLLFALGLGMLSSLTAPAQYTVTNLALPVQHAGVSAIDIDSDGDLDLVVSGENGDARSLRVFKNNGDGTGYTPDSTYFTGTTRTTFDWNDINMDGKLDLILSGFSLAGPIDSVYTSDGAGNFAGVSTIALPQTAPTSGFADLNNDGYTDIYVFGNKNFGSAKIFFNDKLGGFTSSSQFDAYNFVDPVVNAIDFDNDKDLDLFVMAGYEDAAATRFSRMFVNNGTGTFTVQNLNLVPKGNGSSTWGDYDGDGDLDLILNGDGFLNSGEDNDGIYRLYRNNAGTFTAVTTFESYRQNHTGNGSRFVDWDNDGDLDVIVTGWNGNRQATAIYLNNNGAYTEALNNATLPGVSESSIEVADLDNDADLDLILTGYSGNNYDGAGSALNGNVTLVITNPSSEPNTPPTSPTNLHVNGTQSAIIFSWDAATDASTPTASLSYNMYVVDDQGHTFVFSNADTSTGALRLPRMGNVQLNTGWTLHDLPVGNYRWGVQAIDNSLAPSIFARGVFTVKADGTLPISLSAYKVVAEDHKAKIEWTTGAEQNNDHFDIFRSGDGAHFTKLETVKAKNGAGSNHYYVYDNNPSSGLNYYRLVQFDVNGQSKEMGIKTASFNTPNKPGVIAFPNPALSEVGIRLSNYTGSLINVTLTDMFGKLIHSEKIAVYNSQGYYKLSLKTRPSHGEYILGIKGENLKASLKIIIK